jgi:hypothetical protein
MALLGLCFGGRVRALVARTSSQTDETGDRYVHSRILLYQWSYSHQPLLGIVFEGPALEDAMAIEGIENDIQ